MTPKRPMTEAEWLACDDPTAIIFGLSEIQYEETRKLQLFACACCRRIWHLLAEAGLRRSVELAEAAADQPEPVWEGGTMRLDNSVKRAVHYATIMHPSAVGPIQARASAYHAVMSAEAALGSEVSAGERAAQVELLRDIFGPILFRPVLAVPPWSNGLTAKMAQRLFGKKRP